MSEVHNALKFLSNIPFGGHNEKMSRRKNVSKNTDDSSSSSDSDSEDEETSSSLRLVQGNKNFVPVVPIRGEKWEGAMLRRGFLSGRIFFSPSTTSGASITSRGYPTSIFSVVGYEKRSITEKTSGTQSQWDVRLATTRNKRGYSTRHLLHATWGQCSWIRDQRDEHPPRDMIYHPDFLDDPEIRQSKQRTVMHLSGIHMQTMIPYVRVHELEDQLNSQFRQKHPWLSPDITLSMIRRLKRLTVRGVSCSSVMFEREARAF